MLSPTDNFVCSYHPVSPTIIQWIIVEWFERSTCYFDLIFSAHNVMTSFYEQSCCKSKRNAIKFQKHRTSLFPLTKLAQ